MAKGLKARTYYWNWLSSAFSKSAVRFDFWFGGATTVLALVAHFVPTWAALVNDFQWQIVELVGAVWATTIFVRLIQAPYLIWREQKSRILEFERQLDPKVAIGDPVGMPFPKKLAEQHALRFFSIPIENISSTGLTNCRAKMLRFVNNRGEEEEHSGMLFRLRRERFSEIGKHDFSMSFSINSGDTESIDIVKLEERTGGSKVEMQYATATTERVYAPLPRSLFPHWLTVRVTADNMARPADKTFRIYLTDDGRLRMESDCGPKGTALGA